MLKQMTMLALGAIALISCQQPVAAPAQEGGEEWPVQTYVLDTPYEVPVIKAPTTGKIKNVVLMIGDGMSLMHVYSAWTANRGHLFLENCPVTGLSKTYCADQLITDSGAGGTAMAIGQKTKYHSVGVDSLGQAQPSLVYLAKEKGLGAGLAVTCRLWDATPADFCCHNVDRDAEDEIVADYVNCPIDYVVGGGLKRFEGRADGRNLLNELQQKGYQVARSWQECQAIDKLPLFAVTDSVDTPLPKERGDRLAQSTLKGLNLLKAQYDKGFFFMCEGSQLDDYGHFNDLDLLMQETLDFDRTVGAVLQWAAQDGETLVVVTADHETGGLTLVGGNKDKGEIQCRFSTTSHSGVMVPVYAFGPGAEQFTGIFENADIFHKIATLLNLNK